MTIKVLEKTPGCAPVIIPKGEWIDLHTASDVTLSGPYATSLRRYHKDDDRSIVRYRDVVFNPILIPLGVCMQLPPGFEAVIVPRSSTFLKYGIQQANSQGVIDNGFAGNDDEWQFPALPTRSVFIPKGTRLCQFRIQLSQKATFFQRLRWLFSSKLKIRLVQSLSCQNRSGFGSTGD